MIGGGWASGLDILADFPQLNMFGHFNCVANIGLSQICQHNFENRYVVLESQDTHKHTRIIGS